MQRSVLSRIGIFKEFKRIAPSINMPQGFKMPGSSIDFLGKNKRVPKRANHGARPCSHVMRRLKKKTFYHRKDVNSAQDPLDLDIRPLHKEGGEINL